MLNHNKSKNKLIVLIILLLLVVLGILFFAFMDADCTWKEFQKMSGPEQEKFVESFESLEEFNNWERKAKSQAEDSIEETKNQWNDSKKNFSEYSWEEFQNMSGPEQEMFVESFKSPSQFEEWEKKVKGEE